MLTVVFVFLVKKLPNLYYSHSSNIETRTKIHCKYAAHKNFEYAILKL